jgi:hypothetical protein
MSKDPYWYLNDYEKDFQQQAAHFDTVFNHPVTNDPLSMLENKIEANRQIHPSPNILSQAETAIESTVIPPAHGPLDPLPHPREIIDRRNIGVRGLDPPGEGYNWTSENRYWREPPLWRPMGGGGRRGKSHSPLIKPASGRVTAKASSKTKCPKTGKECSTADCKKCAEYDDKNVSIIHNYCKKQKAESQRLAGKKKEK